MKKIIAMCLVLALSVGLAGCAGILSGGSSAVPTQPSTEELYAQLVSYAQAGEYQEAWRLCQRNPSLLQYEDAQKYMNYCDALEAYEVGAMGTAYELLSTCPDILDAQTMIDDIEEKILPLNGYYVADNKKGSYLHLVIRNGKVTNKVIGYTDEVQTFDYENEGFWYDLVVSTYTTGEEMIAFGLYNSLGAEVDLSYSIHVEEGSDELMVVKFAGEEFDTFNGIYKKVEDVT